MFILVDEARTVAKDRRETILQAALELIAERGFHGAPMSAVAQRAGASAGIIYHYFESKDELIHALYQRVSAELSEAMLLGDPAALAPAEGFKRLWLNAYRYYQAHPNETRFMEQYKRSPYHCEPARPDDLFADERFGFIGEQILQAPAESLFKDLPIDVIYEMTLAVAARVALRQGAGALTDQQLMLIADGCWQAVAR
jgi:AcrR family transcriptional regulator